MSLIDLLIIYLACGAPVSVNYYFQNHGPENSKKPIKKSLFVLLAWFPFILKQSFQTNKSNLFSFFISEKDFGFFGNKNKSLASIKKQLELFGSSKNLQMSIFEFREIIERYAGLTVAVQNEQGTPTKIEENLLEISSLKKVEAAATCLHRRNQKRLVRHQNEARSEILHLFERLFVFHPDREKFGFLAIEFVILLNDSLAIKAINQLILETSPANVLNVLQYSEKDLWKVEKQKSV